MIYLRGKFKIRIQKSLSPMYLIIVRKLISVADLGLSTNAFEPNKPVKRGHSLIEEKKEGG